MRTWRTRSVARRCHGRCKYLARRSGKPWNAACAGSHGPGCRAERHQAGARLGRRGTFAGNPAAHPREHLSQNSHHHLAHRVIHSVSGAHPGPWEASRADRPGDFRNIGDGQKTANPAGHGRDLARHFFPTLCQQLYPQDIDSRSEEHGRTISPGQATGRPNPWGSPGGPLPAQFANSFSTGNPRNGNARENVSRTSPLDAMMPMDTGFSGFPGKSAAIDGSMLGGAMGGSAVHSFAMHRRGAFHSTFSLALSPTGRNSAAPSNAFPRPPKAFFQRGMRTAFPQTNPQKRQLPTGHFARRTQGAGTLFADRLPAARWAHPAMARAISPNTRYTQTYPQHAHSA